MMTHTQLKTIITEAVLLFILSIALVIGGYFVSSENANKRLQNLYHTRFDVVMNSASYEKVNSKALNSYPEIKGVYIGYDADGAPDGYVLDLTVKSLYGQDLSMLVALDYAYDNREAVSAQLAVGRVALETRLHDMSSWFAERAHSIR